MSTKENFIISENKDIKPKCPYCEYELAEIYKKTIGKYSFLMGCFAVRDVIYFCPHCHKVLGGGQSRLG